MTAPAVTNTLANGNTVDAPQLNTNFSDLVTYISNRNDGTATWDRCLVTSSTAVPLIVNNSTGSSAIAQFNDNGSTVFTIIDGGDVYSTAFTDYSSTSTVTGWTSFTTKQIFYKKIGKLVWVFFYLEGTSNATTVSFTLPLTSVSTSDGQIFAVQVVDNGSSSTAAGRGVLPGNDTTVTCHKDFASGAWTNSGSKLARGQFFYQTS